MNFLPDCGLCSLNVQLEDRSPLDRMRAVAGFLMAAIPRGKTFLLCDECRRIVDAARSGQFVPVDHAHPS